MRATVSWVDNDGKPIVQQSIDVNLSNVIVLDPVLPSVKVGNGKYSKEVDLRDSIKAVHIQITEVDGESTRVTLSLIKAYVDQVFFRERKKYENMPWYHPIKRMETFHNYQFVHIIRELIKKVD